VRAQFCSIKSFFFNFKIFSQFFSNSKTKQNFVEVSEKKIKTSTKKKKFHCFDKILSGYLKEAMKISNEKTLINFANSKHVDKEGYLLKRGEGELIMTNYLMLHPLNLSKIHLQSIKPSKNDTSS
jgi:hypothetical protein